MKHLCSYRLLILFIVYLIVLLLITIWTTWLSLEITIAIVGISATFAVGYYSYKDGQLSRKLEAAGVKFCAGDVEYRRAAAALISGAKKDVLSLLSTWHGEKEIFDALERCEATKVVFMGPIGGHRFPSAINRIIHTMRINKERRTHNKSEIEVYHRASTGVKFVVADDNVLINSKPVKADTDEGLTAGFVIERSSEHADFFSEAFNEIQKRETVMITGHDRIRELIRNIIREKQPVSLESIASQLNSPGELLSREETERYHQNLTWYIETMIEEKLIRRTREGLLASNNTLLRSMASEDQAAQPKADNSEKPKPYLTLALTSKCHFKCCYCPPRGECYGTPPGDIPLQSALDIINLACDQGISKIRLTGGDPFMHRDFQKIVNHAASKGLQVHISSNGVDAIINLSWLSALSSQVIIKISLDCMNRETMNHITGDGDDLDRVRSSITQCAQHGILQRINFILTTANWHELPAVLRLAKECQVDLKVFDMFYVPDTETIWREWYFPPSILTPGRQPNFSYPYSVHYGIPTDELEVQGVQVRIKDSTNGTHYNLELCDSCEHHPCQEGLYCLVVTPSMTVVPCRLGTVHYRNCSNADEVAMAVEYFSRIYAESIRVTEFPIEHKKLIERRNREYQPKAKHLLVQ